jgi:hypothetical protein
MRNIYLKSRGVSKGYCWVNQKQEEVYDLPEITSAIARVNSDDFSLLIHRFKGKLSLLVTGLKSENRRDNQTRPIKNMVLWVGDESEENILRNLAIQALRGDLAIKVNRAVSSTNNDVGFEVDFQKLIPQKLVDKLPQKQSMSQTNLIPKIGNLTELKKDLIQELETYSLPTKKQFSSDVLVLVSETLSQGVLKGRHPWRGLSETISRDEDWIPVAKTKSQSFNIFKPINDFVSFVLPMDSKKSKKNNSVNLIISLVLVVSLAFNFLAFLNYNKNKSLANEIEKKELKIEELNQKLNELRRDITQEQETLDFYKDFEKELIGIYKNLQNEVNNLEKKYPQILQQ